MNLVFFRRIITTSIGRKLIMALTGLLLTGFVSFHLMSNLVLLNGQEAYNAYVAHLTGVPFLLFIELGLFSLFLVHILMGIYVRWEDYRNSPSGYEKRNWQGGRTIGSATMLYTAATILIFVAYHIFTFRFGDHSAGFYAMVTDAFRDPVYVTIYVLGALAMILHLSHGVQSIFQTLGINHLKYTPFIKLGGWIIALAMVAFALLPLIFLFGLETHFMGLIH
ncbi:MAG: succinate dehydrogenase cytochrome b subunit [Elusimicrobiota bacterium]|nr:succinate dehydrogenase cytochrome b subunit [Elusimicrobiota bacterium]